MALAADDKSPQIALRVLASDLAYDLCSKETIRDRDVISIYLCTYDSTKLPPR
jgi:hypothetical protein